MFKSEAGISYYGKVIEIREVERREITELPKDSNELYYLIKIEKWIELPKKIEVMGYAVRRCLYSSEYLLKNSTMISELLIKSKEEYRVCCELKRFGEKASLNEDDNKIMHMECGNGKLIVFNKNEISVYSKGNVEKFSISEFSRNIRKVIQI